MSLCTPPGLPILGKLSQVIAITLLIACTLPVAHANQEACQELVKGVPLAKIDLKSFEYQGLTKDGVEALKAARDTLRERVRLFDNELRNLTTLHHAGIVARLFKGNMFLYGPPGGAKSAFVNWLMTGEGVGDGKSTFKLQLHQMMTEQAFVGGQNFEAAKQGRFETVTEGALVEYAVALIDEMEKGNPSALSALLSLLNEREVLAGNKIIKARLETLFATSNANLPEIFQQFLENGQGSTAAALLNRFQFKAFVYNWLSPQDQAVLDQRKQRMRYLKALAEAVPDVLKDQVFLKPKVLDWSAMRQLAQIMFEPSPLFMTVFREFTNDMRTQTNRAIKESEERQKASPMDEPFVYFPSADYTERLRQQIPEIIIQSAFVDFLLSPLADDKNLEQMTQKQILLQPDSIWRAYLVMTTIGPGNAKLKLDKSPAQTGTEQQPNSDESDTQTGNGYQLDIDFDWSIDANNARDKREELLIQNLRAEQERFRSTFLDRISKIQGDFELSARHPPNHGSFDFDSGEDSFELRLMHSRGELAKQ